MGDYTNMSGYYDLIMTSGYYDYEKIVDHILDDNDFSSVLEIGCGTGLILEELVQRSPNVQITGVDLTPSMLSIATNRLQKFSNISLSQQNVTQFDMQKQYDLAFSYGGVWYFVIDGENEPFMVSHIADHAANVSGIQHLARHVNSGGKLMLGIQGPHHDYASPISNGMIYSQKIKPTDHGFIKDYYLADGDKVLMSQTIHYRTYSFTEALDLLGSVGFTYQADSHRMNGSRKFLEFNKA